LWLSGHVSLSTLPLVGLLLFSSSVIFLGSAIIIHSLAFWVTSMESLSRQLMEFLIVFSVYPQSAFTGPIKWMLFSIIPAGFIGYLPVQILREFSWMKLCAVVASASFYFGLALLTFHSGLKRYESGNRMGIRV
jgi:ABC-2 type transport system permease protein